MVESPGLLDCFKCMVFNCSVTSSCALKIFYLFMECCFTSMEFGDNYVRPRVGIIIVAIRKDFFQIIKFYLNISRKL